MPRIIQYSFIVLTLCVLASCKKKCNDPSNEDCRNYDPCYGKQRTNANFIIEERVGERWIVGDTIDGANSIRFTALQDADSFIWTLGAETLYTKSIVRHGFPPKTWIDIQLIVVRKNPSKGCFPGDDGRDTLHRKFYSWDRMYGAIGSPSNPVDIENYPIWGGYFGYNVSNPNKHFFVKITDTFMIIPPCPGTNINPRPETNDIIEGIPYSDISNMSLCNTTIGHVMALSPKAVYLYHSAMAVGSRKDRTEALFPSIKAHAILTRDFKGIEVDYEWKDTTNFSIKYKDKFIGRKLW